MEETPKFSFEDVAKHKTNGILITVFPVLCFLPLVNESMKSSEYLRFYANQTLLVLIANVATSICKILLSYIPVVGDLLGWGLGIVAFVFYIINIVHASRGDKASLPLIGGIEIIK